MNKYFQVAAGSIASGCGAIGGPVNLVDYVPTLTFDAGHILGMVVNNLLHIPEAARSGSSSPRKRY